MMIQLDSSYQLAVIIAAPHEGETAMYNDMSAMARVLQGRGLSADQILCLHGRINRQLVLTLLQTINQQVAIWKQGTVFLHFSGHGFFVGETLEKARPGLLSNCPSFTDLNSNYWAMAICQ